MDERHFKAGVLSYTNKETADDYFRGKRFRCKVEEAVWEEGWKFADKMNMYNDILKLLHVRKD
jgi:hypothetical protein